MYLADSLRPAYLPYGESQTIAPEVERINVDTGCVPKTIYSPGKQTAHNKGRQPSRAKQDYQGNLAARDKRDTFFSSRITVLWDTRRTEC